MFIWCHSVSLAVAFSKISHQHILSKVISKCHIQAHTTANKSVLAGNCTGFIVGSSIGSYYPVPLMTSAVLAQCVTRTSSFNTHTHTHILLSPLPLNVFIVSETFAIPFWAPRLPSLYFSITCSYFCLNAVIWVSHYIVESAPECLLFVDGVCLFLLLCNIVIITFSNQIVEQVEVFGFLNSVYSLFSSCSFTLYFYSYYLCRDM